jgi:hypothetical protein
MESPLSTTELAREISEALRKNPMSPHEHWEFLVREGIIDRDGRVLCNKLFGTLPDQPLDPGDAGLPEAANDSSVKSSTMVDGNSYPSPKELSQEALEALRQAPSETPNEHIARLVRLGLVNRQGRLTRLFGGEAEPEIDKADDILRGSNGSSN